MASPGSHTAHATIGAPINTPYAENNPSHARQSAPISPEGIAPWAAGSRLAALIAEHDDLDVAISVLLETGKRDDLLITRLKKRKLQIKDEIASAAP